MANGAESQRMPLDRDDESGRYKQSYTQEMALEAIDERCGAATTSEVADHMGSSRRLALRRLRELEDDGRVTSREAGNTYLWGTTDEV